MDKENIMSKMLKVEVAKSLPFSKERSINHVGDLIYKLRESGKMKGFLPSPTERVNTFEIDYKKTQKIDFRKVLKDVLGEKEGFSLPLLSALMSWSKEGETKTALEYQSVLYTLIFHTTSLREYLRLWLKKQDVVTSKGRWTVTGQWLHFLKVRDILSTL